MLKLDHHKITNIRRASAVATITQDMRFRLSLIIINRVKILSVDKEIKSLLYFFIKKVQMRKSIESAPFYYNLLSQSFYTKLIDMINFFIYEILTQ